MIFLNLFIGLCILQAQAQESQPSTPEIKTDQEDVRRFTDQNEIDIAKTVEADEKREVFALEKHHANYFLYGQPSTKIQFSFKYQVVRKIPFYIGYTQLGFWDLTRESKPFKDTNFNPELFYRLKLNNSYWKYLDISPIEHKSNGREGEASRGFNRSYLLAYGENTGKSFVYFTQVKIAQMYGQDEQNLDIQNYIGPLEIRFGFTEFTNSALDRLKLEFMFFPGGNTMRNFWNGAHEIDISFRFGGADLNPSLMLQFYEGNAETLIDYDKRVQQFRVGIRL